MTRTFPVHSENWRFFRNHTLSRRVDQYESTYWSGPSCSKLTMSLVNVSLKPWSLTMAYTLIFLLKKMWVAFFSKNTCEFGIVLTRTVNILTTNELVKLTTLWTTGPWTFTSQVCRNVLYLLTSLKRCWMLEKGHYAICGQHRPRSTCAFALTESLHIAEYSYINEQKRPWSDCA